MCPCCEPKTSFVSFTKIRPLAKHFLLLPCKSSDYEGDGNLCLKRLSEGVIEPVKGQLRTDRRNTLRRTCCCVYKDVCDTIF